MHILVTELATNGSVEDVLKDKSLKISFHRKMKIARETAAGMNWLHCMKPSPLLHLDLKTANLLVSHFFDTNALAIVAVIIFNTHYS